MRKNMKETLEVTYKINYDGNWNHKNKELPYVKGKPICVVYFNDGNSYVFSHKDILKLIEGYLIADEESIKMIENPDIDTGEVKYAEARFKDKIRLLLIRVMEDLK